MQSRADVNRLLKRSSVKDPGSVAVQLFLGHNQA